MDEFLKYFENEKFVNWVYHTNKDLDNYWNDWLTKHPEEKTEIEFARLILKQLQSRQEKASTEEAIALYSVMIGKLNNNSQLKSKRTFVVQVMRYAAVAIIFLSLGVLLMYNQNRYQFSNYDQSMVSVLDNSEAQLILSNGQKINLQEKDSKIEYKADGKIIINKTDTLQNTKNKSDDEMNQLVVPFGKTSSVRLPDGTLAHLNAGSRLIYPEIFSGKTREVYLLGEAYFEVTHNPNRPFVVKTNALSIVALGTVFNVSAYPTDKIIETVLLEGKVVLRDNSFKIFSKDFVLSPNELASFNKETLETNSRKVDTEQYVNWHKGFLNFQSSDLSRIIRQVERYYNIRIILENPMLGDRSISGKLMLKENMESVLQVLASTARVEMHKINETTYGLK